MMKIINTRLIQDAEKDYITVWTDEDPTIGFNFELDSIQDKSDLYAKVLARVNELKAKNQKKETNKHKYNTLATLKEEI